jgi:hypothetical protein
VLGRMKKSQDIQQEFIELFPYYKVKSFRAYIGFTYLIHVTPKRLGKDIYRLV